MCIYFIFFAAIFEGSVLVPLYHHKTAVFYSTLTVCYDLHTLGQIYICVCYDLSTDVGMSGAV